MNVKKVVIILLIIILLIEATFYFLTKKETIFSLKPEDWIKKQVLENKTIISIDIIEATQGQGEYDTRTQKLLNSKGELTAIQYNPFYEGKKFSNLHTENEKTLMKITPLINPQDKIPEAFALLKEEKYGLVLYTFVDEDWKTKSNGEIYLTWGDIKNKEEMQTKKYNFEKSTNKVYTEKIQKADFLTKNNPFTRVFIGEITKNDIINGNYNKTFLMIT